MTIAFSFILLHYVAGAQELADGQNPSFAVSRAKYMKLADSLNQWHGTTSQETYKAIDWLEDRRAQRAENRQLRREYRLRRYQYQDDFGYNYYYPGYRNGWRHYNYYPTRYSHRNGSLFLNPWGIGYWWR